MARIPEAEIERLKEAVPMARLVEASGIELKKVGKDLLGRCPFHEDATASLVVTPPAKNLCDGPPQAPLVYYVYTDHLDTPRVVIDQAGNQRWSWVAEPFGHSAPITSPTGLAAVGLNLRFAGQYYDAETGLSYNHHRDYDASIGRYTQSDPIGLAGGINAYAYVGGNPVSYIDPDGLRGGAVGGGPLLLTYNPGIRPPGPQLMPNMSVAPTNPYVGPQAGMQLIADSIGNLDYRTPSNVNWGGPLPGPPVPPGCTMICIAEKAGQCSANSGCSVTCGPVVGPTPR
jgi:RHS repeat-associated protein